MADVVLHAVSPRLLIRLVGSPYAFYLPGGVTSGKLRATPPHQARRQGCRASCPSPIPDEHPNRAGRAAVPLCAQHGHRTETPNFGCGREHHLQDQDDKPQAVLREAKPWDSVDGRGGGGDGAARRLQGAPWRPRKVQGQVPGAEPRAERRALSTARGAGSGGTSRDRTGAEPKPLPSPRPNKGAGCLSLPNPSRTHPHRSGAACSTSCGRRRRRRRRR